MKRQELLEDLRDPTRPPNPWSRLRQPTTQSNWRFHIDAMSMANKRLRQSDASVDLTTSAFIETGQPGRPLLNLCRSQIASRQPYAALPATTWVEIRHRRPQHPEPLRRAAECGIVRTERHRHELVGEQPVASSPSGWTRAWTFMPMDAPTAPTSGSVMRCLLLETTVIDRAYRRMSN